ncbi:MAG: hypothetical protein JW726_07875 [Anaerolineales bacterium]|nr:hypothetical protein [Anaerolineales bacterium]
MQAKIIPQMEGFILRAKAATYVGGGQKLLPYRLGSHDLQFAEGDWAYHDSYFGGSDFIGEEVVYYQHAAVWAMNYYGHILKPEQISAAQAGAVIQQSLSKMYQEGRFLGGFEHQAGPYTYYDTSHGDVSSFTGREWITFQGEMVYELIYHGGLIKD